MLYYFNTDGRVKIYSIVTFQEAQSNIQEDY